MTKSLDASGRRRGGRGVGELCRWTEHGSLDVNIGVSSCCDVCTISRVSFPCHMKGCCRQGSVNHSACARASERARDAGLHRGDGEPGYRVIINFI